MKALQLENMKSLQLISSLKNFSSIFRANGSHEWYDLENKIIKNKTSVISNMGDIHTYEFKHYPKILSDNVMLYRCDKNFVYYWLDQNTFPNVKNIILFSHPCEPGLFHRWNNQKKVDTWICLQKIFGEYKTRWAPKYDNVVVLNDVAEKFIVDNIILPSEERY